MSPSPQSPMLVVGSVAFDTIHNVSGTHPRVLGGSATFASITGSFFTDVQLVGVVGTDFPDDVVQMLRKRGVDTSGLEIAEGKTFHWEGRYADDFMSRESLATDLNVFADFQPKIPDAFVKTPFVMLGNIHPSLQAQVLDQVDEPELVIADTMDFWINSAKPALLELLPRVDVLVINEEEARQLTGLHHIVDVSKALKDLGPQIVVIKQGEYGAFLFVNGEIFSAPAFPIDQVADPTGAGDSFAGGFLGYIANKGDATESTLRSAVIHGSALASFCVEGISVDRLMTVTEEELAERVAGFRKLVHFDH